MSRAQLRLSGFLAMISALLAIPWFLVVYVTRDHGSLEIKLLEAALLVIGTTLFVYVISTLRRFLPFRYSFTAADRPIALLVKGNIVISAIGLLGLFSPTLESSVMIVTVLLAIPLGIVQIMFGRTLLQFPHDLNGLRTPYAWLNMITGGCQATIYLMPVALFTGAVADVMLGTILLQAAGRGRADESRQNQ